MAFRPITPQIISNPAPIQGIKQTNIINPTKPNIPHITVGKIPHGVRSHIPSFPKANQFPSNILRPEERIKEILTQAIMGHRNIK